MSVYNHSEASRKLYDSYLNVLDLSEQFIQKLLHEERIITLEYTEAPSLDYWRKLNNSILTKKKNIGIRLYGTKGVWRNLSFLKELSNLKRFQIDDIYLEDLSPIVHFDDLIFLKVGNTISNKKDIQHIEKFKKLEELAIEGKVKNIDVISKLTNLKKLQLYSVSLKRANLLKNMLNLEKLIIFGGGIEDLQSIGNLYNLKYMCLEGFKKMDNIDFVTELKQLTYLYLRKFTNLSLLPNFDNNISLNKIIFEYVNGITNLNNITTAKQLQEFIWFSNQPYIIEDFSFIFDIHSLKHFYLNCLSKDEFEEINKIAKQRNINFSGTPSGEYEYLTL